MYELAGLLATAGQADLGAWGREAASSVDAYRRDRVMERVERILSGDAGASPAARPSPLGSVEPDQPGPVLGSSGLGPARSRQVEAEPCRGPAAPVAGRTRARTRPRHALRCGRPTSRRLRSACAGSARSTRGSGCRARPDRPPVPAPTWVATASGQRPTRQPEVVGPPLPVGLLGVEEEALVERPDVGQRVGPQHQEHRADQEIGAPTRGGPGRTPPATPAVGVGKGQPTRASSPVSGSTWAGATQARSVGGQSR